MLFRTMIGRILVGSRLSIMLAVVCSLLAAITLLIYGARETFATIGHAITASKVSSKETKFLILSFIEIIDLFLLATVLYITGVGLYELFIDNRIKVPTWLAIGNIEDLKNKLASVVVVILGVVFLGQAVKWESGNEILPFGLSVALVIAALTYFLSEKNKSEKTKIDIHKINNRKLETHTENHKIESTNIETN